jgi:hypothetical protein
MSKKQIQKQSQAQLERERRVVLILGRARARLKDPNNRYSFFNCTDVQPPSLQQPGEWRNFVENLITVLSTFSRANRAILCVEHTQLMAATYIAQQDKMPVSIVCSIYDEQEQGWFFDIE